MSRKAWRSVRWGFRLHLFVVAAIILIVTVVAVLIFVAKWNFKLFDEEVITMVGACWLLQLVAGSLCMFSSVPWAPNLESTDTLTLGRALTAKIADSVNQKFFISLICNFIAFLILVITFGDEIFLSVTAAACVCISWYSLILAIQEMAKRLDRKSLDECCVLAIYSLFSVLAIGIARIVFAFVAAELATPDSLKILSLVGLVLSIMAIVTQLVLLFAFSLMLYRAQKCI